MNAIEKLSHMTGLPQKQVLQILLGLLVMFVVFGIGSSLLTTLIGVAYPAFMSFVALESEGEDDDKQWLTYWVVFGTFSIIDQFTGIILSLIPFYYVLKVAFLIWMFHPTSQGATTIYDNFILPFFKHYEKDINECESKLASKISESRKAD